MKVICQKCGIYIETAEEPTCWGPREITDLEGEQVISWGYTCAPCVTKEPEHWQQVLKDRQKFLKKALSAFLRHPTEGAATAYKGQLYSYADMWESIQLAITAGVIAREDTTTGP